MAKTFFSMDMDPIDLSASKEVKKKGDEVVPELKAGDLYNALNSGTLKAIGVIFTGKFDVATGEVLSEPEDSAMAVKDCIIITVGGSAYKICP